MKSQKTNKRIWVGVVSGLILVLLTTNPRTTLAQEWTTNGSHISNTNSGNVGIGTTTPASKLEVVGGGLFGGHVQLKTVTPIFLLTDTSGPTDQRQFYFWNSGGKIIGNWANDAFTAISTIGVTFQNNGFMGVGTMSPLARLYVEGATGRQIGSNTWADMSGAASGYALFGGNMYQDSNPVAFKYANTHGSIGAMGFAANYPGWNQASIVTSGTTSSTAGSSFTPQVVATFDYSGNVGIGTTGPGYRLDVQGGQVNASGGLCMAGVCKTAWSQVGGAVASVFGRTGAVVAATNDYTWAQVNKTTSSLADLATRSASDLSSGTLPDARFPAALPSASGANLTALNASSLGSGTVATARLGSGTADATKFLRGDNTWAVPSGGSQWSSGAAGSISYSGGNVGIGTTTPSTKLHVVSGSDNSTALLTLDTGVHGGTQMVVYGTPNNESGFEMSVYRGGQYFSRLGVSSAGNVYLQAGAGSVGIGTATPNSSYKLDVNGNTNVTGNLNVTGNIAAKYQDVAEWAPSSERISAGTVVVLDSTKSNHVIASAQAYDTRVAGVISQHPGIVLGESGEGKVLVATTGRVLVKVDAARGPIHIGDLLVSSDVPGVAMKSEPVNIGGVQLHRPGTLIGKALEPLAKGQGEILVLLSLQ